MNSPGGGAGSVIDRPWFRWFWRIIAIFWMVMFATEARALLSGDAEAYPHQHIHGMGIELGGLLLALSFLAANRTVRWTFMISASVVLAAIVAFGWLGR